MSDKEDGEIEDGEIETDEETSTPNAPPKQNATKISPLIPPEQLQPSTRKTIKPVEGDYGKFVEQTLAQVLLKDGVEPPLPNVAVRPEEPAPSTPRSKRRKKPKSERRRNGLQREEEQKPKDQKTAAGVAGTTSIETMDVDEYEMLGMRGGSPPPQQKSPEIVLDSADDSSSYDSAESDGGFKGSNNARGFGNRKRRDRSPRRNDRNKRQRIDRRDRDRDREKDRDRDRGRKSDEERREPRKMEICKFYLQDCCAKRNNCSYLHSEFPCKYYYLGMDCPNKDCKFNHGKPLTVEFRAILVKHLETAPKEILGDFPRLGREKALKMMDAAHINLLRAARGEPPLEEAPKIPSLLDGLDRKKYDAKPKRSRWCDKIPPAPELPDEEEDHKNRVSIRQLNDILTEKQIDDLIAMKIEYVDQTKQLTLLQMTNLGLNIQQISQLTSSKPEPEKTVSPPAASKEEDLDLRAPPAAEDVDLRDVGLRTLMPPALPAETTPSVESPPSYGVVAPSVVDCSQYLRDAQVEEKIGDTSIEDEPVLRIDESCIDSDDSDGGLRIEEEKRTEEVIMSPTRTQESLIASLKQMQEAKQQATPSYTPAKPSLVFESFYDRKSDEEKPRRPSINEIKSPSVDGSEDEMPPHRPSIYDLNDDDSDIDAKIDARIIKGDRDMRITSLLMDSSDSAPNDIDYRLPFKPMAHYIPATEIDASITSHLPIDYKLYECEVPKPDYSELRRNKNTSGGVDSISDPRLRRLLGVKNKPKPENTLPPPIASPDPYKSPVAATTTTTTAAPSIPSSPRVDPRDPRRRREDPPSIAAPSISTLSMKEPNQLDTQDLMKLLQSSPWYNSLHSNGKIAVNQHLATLSGELKRYHQDSTSGKVFDVSFVTNNQYLSVILANLGVFLNENGYFCRVEDAKETPQPQSNSISIPNLQNILATPPPSLLPGIDLNLLNNLRPLLAAQAARNTNPFNIRPSILSMPPPMPIMNENLMRSNNGNGNNMFPNNFPPPLLGNMNGGRNDNFRDNRQDRRNNWNRNGRNHNNNRRRNN